jgi:hypothetical protein
MEVPPYDRSKVLEVYDQSMVNKIRELIEKESVAAIPMSDILLLLPLDELPMERAKRLALANGFKLEKKPGNPYVVFKADE